MTARRPRGPRKPGRGGRERDLWEALAKAEERQQHLGLLCDRIVRGVATFSEYREVMAKDVDRMLCSIIPTLPVVRARRSAGVRTGTPASADVDLARRVLSYLPEEPLPEADQEAIQELQSRIEQSTAPLVDRVSAARGLILMGSADGLPLRRRLWVSGFAETESWRVDADHQKYLIHELLADWQPWEEFLRSAHVEAGGDPGELVDKIQFAPLLLLAYFLLDEAAMTMQEAGLRPW